MQIQAGIIGAPEPWRSVLRQEGLAAAPVHGAPDPHVHAIVVTGGVLEGTALAGVRTYLNDGGAVLTSTANLSHLAGLRVETRRIRTVYPHHDPEFPGLDPVDLDLRLPTPVAGNILRTADNIRTGFLGKVGNGFLIALPFDVKDVFLDDRSTTRSFYSPAARRPFETVSTVSKGSARALIARSLELLVHRRELPYAHVWYYPDGAPSVFAFRIDTDFGTAAQIDALAETLRRAGVRATWFVDVGSQRAHLERYAAMDRDEIGIHCSAHVRPVEASAVAQDIAEARRVLQQAGIEPVGYAAPYGTWNAAVASAVNTSGLAYSSEFSYDYDDLPSRPQGPTGSGVLQIPVHPICIGSMKRHGYGLQEMRAYVDRVREGKLRRREPLVFYHHPRDGNEAVLEQLFERIFTAGIPHLTLAEMASWWNDRDAVVGRVIADRGSITVQGSGQNPRIRVRVSMPDGRETLVPFGTTIVPSSEKWSVSEPAVIPADITRARRFNYRIPLVRGLDRTIGALQNRVRKKGKH